MYNFYVHVVISRYVYHRSGGAVTAPAVIFYRPSTPPTLTRLAGRVGLRSETRFLPLEGGGIDVKMPIFSRQSQSPMTHVSRRPVAPGTQRTTHTIIFNASLSPSDSVLISSSRSSITTSRSTLSKL